MTQKPFDSSNLPSSPEPKKKSSANRRFSGLFRVLRLVIIPLAVLLFAGQRWEAFRAVAIFIATLSVLVFVHEWGHFQFARWAGMKVNRFAIGFPPFVYTKRKNGIDYSIGALPIGGMVDIAGLGSEEEMVATKGEVGTAATTIEGVEKQSSTESRADAYLSQKPRNPHARHGEKLFQDAPLIWRFLTLFAGPLMNFIFAMIIFAGLFSLVGVPEKTTATTTVDVVSPYTPAFKAGLQTDDKIVAINGQKVTKPEEAIKIIRGSGGKAVDLQVVRGTQNLNLKLTPIMEKVEGEASGKPVPIIGIMFLETVESYKRVGLFRGETGFSDSAIGSGLYVSLAQTQQIFGLLRRVATLKMTENDKRSVGGPVKIAQAVNHSARRSWQLWVLTAGALSLNLGLMNLLPIPALDGGRIMFILYEAVTRRPFDARKEGLVNAFGMLMVLCFMLFMTFRDVLPFIQKTMQ